MTRWVRAAGFTDRYPPPQPSSESVTSGSLHPTRSTAIMNCKHAPDVTPSPGACNRESICCSSSQLPSRSGGEYRNRRPMLPRGPPTNPNRLLPRSHQPPCIRGHLAPDCTSAAACTAQGQRAARPNSLQTLLQYVSTQHHRQLHFMAFKERAVTGALLPQAPCASTAGSRLSPGTMPDHTPLPASHTATSPPSLQPAFRTGCPDASAARRPLRGGSRRRNGAAVAWLGPRLSWHRARCALVPNNVPDQSQIVALRTPRTLAALPPRAACCPRATLQIHPRQHSTAAEPPEDGEGAARCSPLGAARCAVLRAAWEFIAWVSTGALAGWRLRRSGLRRLRPRLDQCRCTFGESRSLRAYPCSCFELAPAQSHGLSCLRPQRAAHACMVCTIVLCD